MRHDACATCGGFLSAESWTITICTEMCFERAADAAWLDLQGPSTAPARGPVAHRLADVPLEAFA